MRLENDGESVERQPSKLTSFLWLVIPLALISFALISLYELTR